MEHKRSRRPKRQDDGATMVGSSAIELVAGRMNETARRSRTQRALDGRRQAPRNVIIHPVEVVPHQSSDEQHTRCPICRHLVDELDFEEVTQNIEPTTKRR